MILTGGVGLARERAAAEQTRGTRVTLSAGALEQMRLKIPCSKVLL